MRWLSISKRNTKFLLWYAVLNPWADYLILGCLVQSYRLAHCIIVISLRAEILILLRAHSFLLLNKDVLSHVVQVLGGPLLTCIRRVLWVRPWVVVLNPGRTWKSRQEFLKIPVPDSTLYQFYQNLVGMGIRIFKDSSVRPDLKTLGQLHPTGRQRLVCGVTWQLGYCSDIWGHLQRSRPIFLLRDCPGNKVPRGFCLHQSLRTWIIFLNSMIVPILQTGNKRLRDVK